VLQIERLLKRCVEMDGSDLHLKTDSGKTYVRVYGDLEPLDDEPLFTQAEFDAAMVALLSPEQLKKFEKDQELDFSLYIPGIARFRGNMYQQRSHIQAAFRVIPLRIQTMEELNLPEACYDYVERPRGLVLVTGPAGSGKSTSLAAMIDRINRTQAVHIVTVEDPLEFVHEDHKALMNQREVDHDTLSFANALKYVLRQDPDVILVGEMRDLDTIHLAITAAETGHLVFATLHTVDAVQTVDRIVDVFPIHQQQQIRMQLSVNLLGVVSQTLVKKIDGDGRVAAFEVLNATSAVRNQIRENKTYQISSIIQTGSKQKMRTLDQSLAMLVEQGLVDKEHARSRAKDSSEFLRMLNLAKESRQSKGQAAVEAPPVEAPPEQDGEPKAPATGVKGQPNRPGYRRD
jgi:twitching motility protein PilT